METSSVLESLMKWLTEPESIPPVYVGLAAMGSLLIAVTSGIWVTCTGVARHWRTRALMQEAKRVSAELNEIKERITKLESCQRVRIMESMRDRSVQNIMDPNGFLTLTGESPPAKRKRPIAPV